MSDNISDLSDSIIDSSGMAFNPDLHMADKDGKPKILRNGKFQNKRRTIKSSINIEPDEEVESSNPEIMHYKDTDFDALGMAVAQSFCGICMILGGQEWQPEEPELNAISGAWSHYFRVKGISEIKPEYLLIMVMAPYAAKRFAMPNTQSRIKNWIYKWKNRNARADNGHNVVREDDVSQPSNGRLQE